MAQEESSDQTLEKVKQITKNQHRDKDPKKDPLDHAQ